LQLQQITSFYSFEDPLDRAQSPPVYSLITCMTNRTKQHILNMIHSATQSILLISLFFQPNVSSGFEHISEHIKQRIRDTLDIEFDVESFLQAKQRKRVDISDSGVNLNLASREIPSVFQIRNTTISVRIEARQVAKETMFIGEGEEGQGEIPKIIGNQATNHVEGREFIQPSNHSEENEEQVTNVSEEKEEEKETNRSRGERIIQRRRARRSSSSEGRKGSSGMMGRSMEVVPESPDFCPAWALSPSLLSEFKSFDFVLQTFILLDNYTPGTAEQIYNYRGGLFFDKELVGLISLVCIMDDATQAGGVCTMEMNLFNQDNAGTFIFTGLATGNGYVLIERKFPRCSSKWYYACFWQGPLWFGKTQSI